MFDDKEMELVAIDPQRQMKDLDDDQRRCFTIQLTYL